MTDLTQNLVVRTATLADAPALHAIYAPYVENTAITFEFHAPALEEFTARMARTLERFPYLVAELEGAKDAGSTEDARPANRIVGFAYVSPFKDRPAYNWAVETSIYVAADCRRGGVGRAMHDALEACLRAQGILNMEACIAMPPDDRDEPHLTCDSAKFHTRLGYRLVGRFEACGKKFNRWYDMIWMEKHLGPHMPDAPDPLPFPAVADELRAQGVIA